MSSNVAQARFDYLFRTVSNGLIILDSQGIVRRMNPAAAAMLRVSPDECLGEPAEVGFRANPLLAKALARQEEFTCDVRLPEHRLAVVFGTILEDGERLVVLQDVTERRDLESRREALARSITHDLRNPLSALEGFSDLVRKFGPVNAQQDHFLTRIRQTAQKLYDLSASLVDLAWIDAGMPLEFVPVQLHHVVRSVVEELAAFARIRSVTMATSTQDPLPVIMGDPLRLRQVIYHLLHNAILYSHAEQTVAIHAWQDAEQVFCSVADQGIGILPGELDLIFDRMYRSNDEQVRNLPGGGLGLTMARVIIDRHGGELSVESTYGVGSTFTVALPLAEIR